ncbi:SPFH domain-containing protein [Streptomyces sp. MAR4 CNX-425]|uniref:SPFH domain-containing protein n=1 Tax=Streptomyces sp. MAR4 CNX-425 TaxID=3406343 RepID=UPI003B502502
MIGVLLVGILVVVVLFVGLFALEKHERRSASLPRARSDTPAPHRPPGSGGPRINFGVHVVPAGKVGIVTRRFGRGDPERRFKYVTPYRNSRGVQARVLVPGRPYWLSPVLYRVKLVPRTHVPADKVGLVTAREGTRRPPQRTLGRRVECDCFQDGEAFLRDGGEQGRQIAILPGDSSYYINTELFDVELAPRTYVEPGTVALVIAKDGNVRPPDRPFGRHVECDNFQDGEAFLRDGGEQGRQLAILTGGSYYNINPDLFEVISTATVGTARADGLTADHLKEIAIQIGQTGVVVTLDGIEARKDERPIGPVIPGHSSFRLPWEFLARGGQRGVQEETLGEGSVYALNPWFVRVVLIPTRTIVIEWTKKERLSSNYDAALKPIMVNVQGHRLQVDISQTLEIPEPAAPALVSRFGGAHTSRLGGLVDDPLPVQRFVERVLGGLVETYFNAIASASTVEEFLSMYASTRTDVSSQVRNALAAWGIEARGTTLGEFESADPELDRARRRLADKQMETRELEAEEENSVIRERIRDRERRGERADLELETVVLERKIEVLGRDTIAMEMFLRQLKDMGVPEVVSGNADELLRHLPLQRALALVESAQRHAGKTRLGKGDEAAKSIEGAVESLGVVDTVEEDDPETDEGSAAS